jgi:hypothetical protein
MVLTSDSSGFYTFSGGDDTTNSLCYFPCDPTNKTGWSNCGGYGPCGLLIEGRIYTGYTTDSYLGSSSGSVAIGDAGANAGNGKLYIYDL